MGEMRKKDEVEQSLFQWTTSLLLAIFGVIVALADKTTTLPAADAIKILVTVIVIAPTFLSVVWIFRRARISIKNAVAIEMIQRLLSLFDSDADGKHSPHPKEWQGKLAKGLTTRKTPYYYATVIFIMSACVIFAIWLVL